MNLLRLQKQKGSGHLFLASFPEWGEVPFKLPSLRRAQQYAAAVALADSPMVRCAVFEQIFRECVADESIAFENANLPAGIVDSISSLILYLSGTAENALEYTSELFETFRQQTMVPLVFMKRTICSVMSGYTFEQLDELDYQSLIEMFIQAEQILLDAEIIEEPYKIVSPDETNRQNDIDAELGAMRPSTPAAQRAIREAQMELYRRAKLRAEAAKKVK